VNALSGMRTLLAPALLLAAGCRAPRLVVRHVLPADLPVVAAAEVMTAGPCAVVAGPEDGYAAVLARMLSQRLAARRPVRPGGSAPASVGPVNVQGQIHLRVRDQAGKRSIRQWSGAGAPWRTRQVRTLVRHVDVRVDFVMVEAGSGRRLGVVETHETYDSTGDPRVRGPLGLNRPDDPARVPPTETIVAELLGRCVATFARMVAPQEVVVEVPLRGTLNSDGRRALAAAGRGDFASALKHARSACAARPGDAALAFNLAVLEEKAGHLRLALERYRQVAEMTKGSDRAAAEGIARVGRVLRRLGEAASRPADTQALHATGSVAVSATGSM